MIVKEYNKLTLYFKPHSVVMEYNHQFTVFHAYNNFNKRSLNAFARELKQKRKVEVDEVFSVANRYNISSAGASAKSVGKTPHDWNRRVIY